MAVITAKAIAPHEKARQRLQSTLEKLKGSERLSPGQREALQNRALIDLLTIELWRMNRISEGE